jgi:hypothetical protein
MDSFKGAKVGFLRKVLGFAMIPGKSKTNPENTIAKIQKCPEYL